MSSPESSPPSLPISDAQFARLEELFSSASALPDAAARRAFAERQTVDDPLLRRHLFDLLDHSTNASDRIANAIEAAAQALAPPTDWTGRRFGPYRIVGEIGRGGMGIVFEAVRYDAEYRKRVALKIASQRPFDDLLRDRFLHERQILAELEHPQIARFLDGGTEQDLPYFAMEFVEGKPITAYCQEHQLPLRARIELFRQVCAAIDYAHSRLIVHRDLKPGNILVAAGGTPKVLDFGIAKLLDPSPRDAGSVTTGSVQLWTPDYASPEQVRGQSITTRTDVYSLGLVLYELLSGKRAQIVDTSSPVTIDRSVCETDPEPPSRSATAAGQRGLASQLAGDLDLIVAMAIRKEPEHRYPSVAALSDDLGRYLAGEPIQARESTPAYRAGRFLRRHRVPVAAAVLVAGSILAGGVVSLVQAHRAERRFQQVRQLANTFLFDIHDKIRDLEGATEARAFVVSTATNYLDSLSSEAGSDPQLLLELATAYEKLGTVQGRMGTANLGRAKDAVAAYSKSAELAKRLLKRDANDRHALRLITDSLGSRGELEVLSLGDFQTGLESMAEAAGYSERLINGANPDPKDIRSYLAIQTRRADRTVQSSPKEAEAIYSSLLARGDRLLQLSGTDADRVSMASTYLRLARSLHLQGNPHRAIGVLETGLGLVDPVLATNPNHALARSTSLALLSDFGAFHGDASRFHINQPRKAVEILSRVETIQKKALQTDPKDNNLQQALSITLARKAESYRLYDPAAAIQTALESLAIAERLLSSDPGSYRYRSILTNSLKPLIDAHLAAGQPELAINRVPSPLLSAAEAIRLDQNDLGSVESILLHHLRLGKARTALGQWDRAAHHLGEASRIAATLIERLPKDLYYLRDKADVEEAFGDLARARGQESVALEQYRQATASWQAWAKLAAAASPYPEMHLARLRSKSVH